MGDLVRAALARCPVCFLPGLVLPAPAAPAEVANDSFGTTEAANESFATEVDRPDPKSPALPQAPASAITLRKTAGSRDRTPARRPAPAIRLPPPSTPPPHAGARPTGTGGARRGRE